MIPFTVVQATIGWSDGVHADAQYGRKCRHRVEAAIEAEHKFIQIGRQALLADAMVGAHQPGLQVREGNMDHWQVGVSDRPVAIEHHRFVRIPQCLQSNEPPRILRRLLFPREWSHDEQS